MQQQKSVAPVYLSILTCAAALASCDTFSSKPPLEGKRESIFVQESAIKSETASSKASLSLKNSVKNKNWNVPGGSLSHALDNLELAPNLKKLWSTSIGNGSNSSKRLLANLIIDTGTIFAIDSHGIVRALAFKNGDTLWSTNTSPQGMDSDTLGGGICADDSYIFVATSFGDVIALDKKSGNELWKTSLQTPFRIAPTTHNGQVIVVNVANEAYALDAKSGEVNWEHIGLPEATGLLGGGVPAIHDGKVIIPYSTGEVYALSESSGQVQWVEALNPATVFDPLSSISHIRARPVIYQGKVFAISHGGRMAAFDLATGNRIWQKDIGGLRTPAIVDGYLFMISNDNDLLCLESSTGKVVWAQALKTPAGEEKIAWAGPVMASGKLVLTNSQGQITFFNPIDGKELSTIQQGNKTTLSPVIVDGKLLILSDDGTVTIYG